MFPKRALAALTAVPVLAAPAAAQFGNEWVTFHEETSQRLSAASDVGAGDSQEKDYAWADLDGDGWTDLVSVRKQPQTTTGKRVNVLYMNVGGVLTDATSLYANNSDVGGDLGFNTPTNDRDVAIADVDLDGWLDVITAPALGFGEAKHISHPRVYCNLGTSGGSWAGLLHEDARVQQMITTAGIPEAPAFCGIGAGDVTGDGYPDLHFTDYDTGGGAGTMDMNDKLLINQGNGFFEDESALRMTPTMLSSSFGTASYIADLNLDGVNDVFKSENGPAEAIYNNPANEGFFNIADTAYSGAAYHTALGDLNNDGRLDAVMSDDGSDRYLYNTGTDILGRVEWGAAKTFDFLTGGDDGFGGNSLVVDLDNDTWNDVLITDVDVDIGGCSRRMHIYHNPGGSVGQQIDLVEEAGGSGSGDWKGAKGLTSSDLTGTHDVAAFDIDLDGDLDLVLGRCSSTEVWINETAPFVCQADLGFGGPGTAQLSMCGADWTQGLASTLRITGAETNSIAVVGFSTTSNPTFIPLVGGTIVPWVPEASFTVNTNGDGLFSAPLVAGPAPLTMYAQALVVDPDQTLGFEITNAIQIEQN